MTDTLEHVAFDIETTGLDAADEVTVVGFELELGCRVFYQTGGRDTDRADVVTAVQERTETRVEVSAHDSERGLLEAVSGFVGERFRSADVLLVGYNGETWHGGFDLPFLRTRYAACDVAWPFEELPYADLLPIIRDLFNTTVDGDEVADLDAAYEILCGGAAGAVDPFDESGEAVTAFEEERFEAVILHNVADIRRTGALSRLSQRYCSKSDFQLKSLTPTIHD
ncbi:hypothetical protein [Halosimplex pelagicum]|uniref:Uncharacterized protein n=1 Tax=Halosimplex pelagicum TaxID=869886 RepID=A0A7D5TCE3_9EURY|nr:hypothetical protein [Halosimplex pelagicum]QLH83013.1 hypothetical protein HZS54_15880 [Halosimplex pelagicum]